jgi:glycopeptide antibiotics resistance protein
VALLRSVAEVGAVLGTAPWLWMTMRPDPAGHRRVNLVPLRDLLTLDPAAIPVQVVGNLLVFVAVGFFLPIRFRALASVGRIVLIAAAGSALIETAQYALSLGRVSSADDVLLNAVGAGLAALCSARWWSGRPPPVVKSDRTGSVTDPAGRPPRTTLRRGT